MTPENLRAWRARRNWSKAEAARQLGLSTNAYAYYESGRWKIKKFVALACAALALGVTPHE